MEKHPSRAHRKENEYPVQQDEQPRVNWRADATIIDEDREEQDENAERGRLKQCGKLIKSRLGVPRAVESEEKEDEEPERGDDKHRNPKLRFHRIRHPSAPDPHPIVKRPGDGDRKQINRYEEPPIFLVLGTRHQIMRSWT